MQILSPSKGPLMSEISILNFNSTNYTNQAMNVWKMNQNEQNIDKISPSAQTSQFDIESIKLIKDKDRKLKVVSAELESILVKMMFSSMKNTLSEENSLLGGGYAEKVFDDILLTERSRVVAHNESMGIAKMIYEQNSKYL